MKKVVNQIYKVSVIIPVYGVEKYIERCARSLFEQTLDWVEYIFVDDCSPDESMTILHNLVKEYQPQLDKENKRVIIERMHSNSGLPLVRKRGIELCSGKYIAHCDSDDWVDSDMYRLMYEEAEKKHVDVVVCDFYKTDGDKYKIFKGYNRELSLNEAYKKMFFQEIPWCVWNKLYKAELYSAHQIQFPMKTQGEDMALLLQLFYYVESISYIEMPLYYYMVNTDTIIHVINENNIVSKFQAAVSNVRIVESFLKDKIIDKRISNGMIYLKMSQRDMLVPLIHLSKYFYVWKQTFSEINVAILYCRDICLRHKLRYILLRCHLSNILVKYKLISV
jgi:glycosyltransferase involved in cell wall biosynthesis